MQSNSIPTTGSLPSSIRTDCTIADMAIFPWLRAVRDFYGAEEDFGMASYANTMTYLDRCLDRPAVTRGLLIPSAH